MSGDMKLGAATLQYGHPYCFSTRLKSPAFRATVELTGFPSLKNFSFIMINNSAKKETNENELSERNSFTNTSAKFWWDRKILALILKVGYSKHSYLPRDKHMRN